MCHSQKLIVECYFLKNKLSACTTDKVDMKAVNQKQENDDHRSQNNSLL